MSGSEENKNTSNVVRVCRVFDFDESPSEIYAKLCQSLSLLPAPWGLANVDVITFEDRPDWPIHEVSYRLHEEVRRLEIGLLSRGAGEVQRRFHALKTI